MRRTSKKVFSIFLALLLVLTTFNLLKVEAASNEGYFIEDSQGQWWVIEDGNLEVKILGYDPEVGMYPSQPYEVKVTGEFNDQNADGKQITISLPEGMRYTRYYVFDPVANAPEGEITGAEADLVKADGITKPTKHANFGTYNGDLIYDLVDDGL